MGKGDDLIGIGSLPTVGARLDLDAELVNEDGKALKAGSSTDVVNGGPVLMTNGVENITAKRDGMVHQGESNSFYYGWVHKRNPRTIAGADTQGRTLLVTADGRQTTALGLSIKESADVARSLGMVDAINLDGGGSTTMVVNGQVVNSPSDAAGQRPVGDAPSGASPPEGLALFVFRCGPLVTGRLSGPGRLRRPFAGRSGGDEVKRDDDAGDRRQRGKKLVREEIPGGSRREEGGPRNQHQVEENNSRSNGVAHRLGRRKLPVVPLVDPDAIEGDQDEQARAEHVAQILEEPRLPALGGELVGHVLCDRRERHHDEIREDDTAYEGVPVRASSGVGAAAGSLVFRHDLSAHLQDSRYVVSLALP